MKVVIAGGGTGGHFFPAVAVAEKLREMGVDVLYIGSLNGIEFREKGYVKDFSPVFLDVKGIRGKGLNAFRGLWGIARTVKEVGGILKRFNPDKVLVFGGYASLPVGLAAILLRIPLFIQEQNSIPGKTNLYLSRFSKRVFVGFESALKYFGNKGVYTGNPLRKEVVEFAKRKKELKKIFSEKLGLSPDRKTILIFGGSQGALWINKKILAVSGRLSQFSDAFQIIHLTGGKLTEELSKEYKRKGIKVLLFPFYKEMWELYVVADCAVSRSGAMSIAELSCFGIPTLFIPYPYAVDDHQYYNALELYQKEGCFLEREESLTDARFVTLVSELLFDKMIVEKFSKEMKSFSHPEAADSVARMLLDG